MKDLIGNIEIKVNDRLYLKDPNSSELGKKIISESVRMIDDIGIESFTFRKVAKALQTTESSIYRYFESKHKLLIYIISLYWGWLEYKLVFATANISSAEDQLRAALKVIAQDYSDDQFIGDVNLNTLNRIVISESAKAYLTKEVDNENKIGFYSGFKRLIARISEIVCHINPKFKYPHTLVSTIVEGIHQQKYFADHLPSLSDIDHNAEELATFFTEMAMATIIKGKK